MARRTRRQVRGRPAYDLSDAVASHVQGADGVVVDQTMRQDVFKIRSQTLQRARAHDESEQTPLSELATIPGARGCVIPIIAGRSRTPTPTCASSPTEEDRA